MPVSKPHIVRVGIPSNKYARGRSAGLTQISEHHIVGDAQHVIQKAQGGIIFSTTFTIAMDGTIYQLVNTEDTPFCDNSWQSNARSITIEHAGGHANYPYTEAMYQSSIALHAWLFQSYGDLNCVRHRDIPEVRNDPSKATACPGDLNVERIVNEAKQLLNKPEVDMITQNDVGVLRIGHSEIGGWDVRRTHAGEFDGQFLGAWQGKPMAEFINAQWKNGAPFRDKRVAEMSAYPQLVSYVQDLQVRLQNAENKPAKEIIKEVEKIVEKCNQSIPELPELKAPEPDKVSWITKFLAALLNRKN